MNKLKMIRWVQRFENFERAYQQLQRGLSIAKPSDIEQQGIIQSFEFTFELAWKTLKDYLETNGVECSFPREVIKLSFHHDILPNGEVWLDMLNKRNLLAHTYNEDIANEAFALIKRHYSPEINMLYSYLCEKKNEID